MLTYSGWVLGVNCHNQVVVDPLIEIPGGNGNICQILVHSITQFKKKSFHHQNHFLFSQNQHIICSVNIYHKQTDSHSAGHSLQH